MVRTVRTFLSGSTQAVCGKFWELEVECSIHSSPTINSINSFCGNIAQVAEQSPFKAKVPESGSGIPTKEQTMKCGVVVIPHFLVE